MNPASKIKTPKNKYFQSYLLTKTYNDTFKFQNINENTVNDILDKLAAKSSFGFGGLTTKLIKKTIKSILVKPITIIINQMLNTGIFPDKLKLLK